MNNVALGNDVAVIKLATKIDFSKLGSKVAKVCIPGPKTEPDGSKCVVIGWGKTEKGRTSQLMYAEQKLSSCKNQEVLCITGQKKHSCFGDSGGPLYCPAKDSSKEMLQFGIVSYGDKDCKISSFYTKVSRHTDWIVGKAQD